VVHRFSVSKRARKTLELSGASTERQDAPGSPLSGETLLVRASGVFLYAAICAEGC
jgi:hypothetical protein